MPVAEVYARKFGGPEQAAAIIDHITPWPPPRASSSTSTGPSGPTPATPTGCCGTPSTAAAGRRRPTLKERLLRGLLHRRAATSATPTCWSTRRPLPVSTPTTSVAFLDSDDGAGRGRRRRWPYAAEAGITAVPTYVIDGRWSIPGAQDPARVRPGARRLAATERAG